MNQSLTYLLGALFLVVLTLLYIAQHRAERAEELAQKEIEKSNRRAWDDYRRGRNVDLEAVRKEYDDKKNSFIRLNRDDGFDGDGSGPGTGNA